MEFSFEENNQEIKNWHQKVLRMHKEIKEIDVKTQLEKIQEINNAAKVFDKVYFQYIWITMDKLKVMELNENNIKVVDLVSDIISFPQCEPAQCIQFAKLNLKIFYTNQSLLKSSVLLENFIKNICMSILNATKNGDKTKMTNFIKCQLIIIIELQKLFPRDEFCSNKHLIRLFIGCLDIEVDHFNQHLETIFEHQFETPLFFQEIFSIEEPEKNEQFLRYCILIMFKISGNTNLLAKAITSSERTNFLCQLINVIANNLYIILKDEDFYDSLIKGIVRIMAASNSHSIHYEITEKMLIKNILASDFPSNILSFDILCELLSSIKSVEIIQSYFVLFQDILLKIWNTNSDVTEIRQILIGHILRFLIRIQGSELVKFLKSDLKIFLHEEFDNTSPSQVSFTSAYYSFQQSPSVTKYRELIESINPSQEIVKDFYHLIEVVSKSDWKVHVPMIVKIIDYIISVDDLKTKMILLLKLNPIKQEMNKIPIIIKHKLIKLISSFKSKEENLSSLKNYLDSLLKILIDDDFTTKYVYNINCTNDSSCDNLIDIDAENLLKLWKNVCISQKYH